jgi:hypothetical protein
MAKGKKRGNAKEEQVRRKRGKEEFPRTYPFPFTIPLDPFDYGFFSAPASFSFVFTLSKFAW